MPSRSELDHYILVSWSFPCCHFALLPCQICLRKSKGGNEIVALGVSSSLRRNCHWYFFQARLASTILSDSIVSMDGAPGILAVVHSNRIRRTVANPATRCSFRRGDADTSGVIFGSISPTTPKYKYTKFGECTWDAWREKWLCHSHQPQIWQQHPSGKGFSHFDHCAWYHCVWFLGSVGGIGNGRGQNVVLCWVFFKYQVCTKSEISSGL